MKSCVGQANPGQITIVDLTLSFSVEEVQSQLDASGKFMFTFDIPCFSLFHFHSCKLGFFTQADSYG